MPIQVDGSTTIPVKQLHMYIERSSENSESWDHFNHMDPVYKPLTLSLQPVTFVGTIPTHNSTSHLGEGKRRCGAAVVEGKGMFVTCGMMHVPNVFFRFGLGGKH